MYHKERTWAMAVARTRYAAKVTEIASGRLPDVVRNINGHGGPAGNYDGYMYDFLVCNYRPSKLPMHESDVERDYKDLDECAIFS